VKGKRVLVVGASSGIGRAVGLRAMSHGAQVAFCARRADRLGEAVTAAGGGHAIAADVRDPDECERLVADAVAALGGLDVVVFATGISPLRMLGDTGAEEWAQVLETNLIGAHLVMRAAVPQLAAGGVFAVISSDSVGRPRPGLVPYAASKAALEEMLRGWRFEHPNVRFSCLAVGPTFPTEFGAQFEPELTMEMFGVWDKLGMVHANIMETDSVAEVLVDTLGVVLRNPGVSLDYLVVRPAPIATPDGTGS
jgi:NAD(P)-dependent dehydrogenase (short-subunit alcohol dehydrogenase family)